MHRFKKMRLVSLLVALVMAFGLAPLASPQAASADASATLASISNQIQAVNYWLAKDPTGQGAVSAAHTYFLNHDVNVDVSVLPSLPLNPLTQSFLPDRPFPDLLSAEAAVVPLLTHLERYKYAQDMTTALTSLVDLYENDRGTVATLFPGVTLDQLVNFVTIAQGAGLQNSLFTSGNWQNVIRGNANTVPGVVNGALGYAATHGGEAVGDAVTRYWNLNDLAAAEIEIARQAPSGVSADIVLIKSFIRSRTTASTYSTALVNTEQSFSLTPGGSTQFTINVFSSNATGDLTPVSSNPAVATFTKDGGRFTLTGVATGTAEITAYLSDSDTPGRDWVYKANVTVTSGGGGGGGGPSPVTSTTGSVTVTPSAGGTVSLGSAAKITIPAGALQGTSGLNVTIQATSNPPAPPEGYAIIGAYSFTVGGEESYTFSKPVTLTFTFDPASIPEGQVPAVYYYNGTEWVLLTGTISGNTITVTVDHFTTFAIMAKEAEATPPPPVPAPSFSDVTASYWAFDVIGELSSKGILAGYPDGTFKPDNKITRAEFAKIATLALKAPAVNPSRPTFSDYTPGDWFFGSVETAVYAGLVKGYEDGTFRPNALISREEAATILERSLGKADAAAAAATTVTNFTDDASISAWARGFVVLAGNDGLIGGYPDGSFSPQGDTTRAETSALISRILVLLSKES
jgi:hypothetical protein